MNSIRAKKLFRILRPDEENGLGGIVSRNISSGLPVEALPKCSIANHVGDNPELSPYISTSTDLNKQKEMIHKLIKERPVIYMITIDVKVLKDKGLQVIDLWDYFKDEKLMKLARAWREVLIKDRIPAEAIIESICFYSDGTTEQFKSPKYVGCMASPCNL